MKQLKQLGMAAVATVMLIIPAFAGEIGIPAPAPPPPGSSSTATPGDIEIGGEVHTPGAPSDSAAEVALNFLLSAMSVF
jgi:hypothetical protein